MDVIVTGGAMTAEEQQHYIRYVLEKYPHVEIQKLILAVDGEFVNISIEPRKRVLTKMGGALISDPLTGMTPSGLNTLIQSLTASTCKAQSKGCSDE